MGRGPLFALPSAAAMIGFIVCLGASWILREACVEHGPAKWRMNDLDCTHYFPPGSSSENRGELDKPLACWFSDDLYAMGEPSLRSVAPDVEAYRFTWVPTFEHPLSVRVERRGANVILVATELDGRGGYEAGKVVQRRRLELASAQWKALMDAVNRSPLWREPESPRRSTGLDGEEWLLEGTRSARYRVLHRWSPREVPQESAFVQACLALLRESGLQIPNR